MDGDGKAGAAYLEAFPRRFDRARLRASASYRIRRQARWVTLGQSYGGFLTLTYLSLFPQGVIASFTTGGIPHVPADATDVYRHTFPRMAGKDRSSSTSVTRSGYRTCRGRRRHSAIAASRQHCRTAIRSRWNASRCLGSDFGMKPSFERVHWILDQAFLDGDGSASDRFGGTV